MSPKYVTGDEMLDCIVGMKAGSMDEKGIEFNLDGMIDGGLDMKPVDVCTIFANALDNAIEACDKIAEKSRRWIKLNVKKTDRFLSIKLSNSMVEDNSGITADRLFDGGVQKTSKKDKSLHGFGTLNMKKAIEKYAGMLKAEQGENEFVLSIMIPR
jgi:sensor histidine kinase regulating citrate/malate metabolism